MTSTTESTPHPEAQLLDRLRERLEQAGTLAIEARESLRRGDVQAIEAATSRLETLALEFKLLADEHCRLPDAGAGADRSVAGAGRRLHEATTRLARSAALGGGLLERMVSMSRRLVRSLEGARGETYMAGGQPRELPLEGLRLRGRA